MTQARLPLQKVIIDVMASYKAPTANVLHMIIQERYRPCSLQGVYSELRRLIASGVLLKINKKYYFNPTWVKDIEELAKKVSQRYISSVDALQILPEEAQKNSWRFPSLLSTHDFWLQVLIVLFDEVKDEELYSWIPHPWFFFLQETKAARFYSYLEKHDRQISAILGGNSMLDRQFITMVPKTHYRISTLQSSFHPKRREYISVLSPYILTVRLPKKTATIVDHTFESTTHPRSVNIPRIFDLMVDTTRIAVSLEHNSLRADILQREFKNIFSR